MKKITLLISAFVFVATSAFAQAKPGKTITPQTRTCGTMDNVSQEDLNNMEDWIAPRVAAYLNSQANGGSPEAIFTIPVIVHIVHNSTESVGQGRNVSNARVQQQIQRLNDDFRLLNADASNASTAFQAVQADCQINFCLITTYPSGHAQAGNALAEVGVDRVDATTIGLANTTSGYSTGQIDGTMKPATSWNPNEVMNIWVCQMSGGLLGFAQFPNSGAANTDGVAITYTGFGNTSGPYNLGRTATHEIGHYLNLRHIWGDANCGNDLVADTPTQQTSSGGCPSGVQTDACAAGPNGYMYQNYMDYTNDACMVMFTAGQKARIQAVMNASSGAPRRKTLNAASATLCAPVSTAGDDAGIASITTPTGTLCSGNITPVVVIKNFGSNALTSATINYQVDGAAQAPFAWSGNLVTNMTATVNLPSITASAGPHTFDANTTMPNGVIDGTSTNDAATQTNFTVVTSGMAMPYSEGFEGTYLPTGMTANNSDGLTTWAKTTAAAKTGSASAFMDYFNYNTSKGEYDDIITPAIDLTSSSNPEVTFELAYSMYTDPSTSPAFSDTLEVLVSTDCGATWTSIYLKSSAALATATPNFTTASFVPTPNQWRMETISLAAYASSNSAMVMFRGIGDYENQMYIDDINIKAGITTGLDNLSADNNVNVYPNPATGVINIMISNLDVNTQITVMNVVGEVVYSKVNVNSSVNRVDMTNQANGVYFVKIKSGNQVTTKKVILAH